MYLSVVLQPWNGVLHSGSCDRSWWRNQVLPFPCIWVWFYSLGTEFCTVGHVTEAGGAIRFYHSHVSECGFTALEQSSAQWVMWQKLVAQSGFTIPMYLSVVLQPWNRVLHRSWWHYQVSLFMCVSTAKFYTIVCCDYWAIQAGLLTPLTFARHRLSPLAAFTSSAYFLLTGRQWQWICKFHTADFKGIFGGP